MAQNGRKTCPGLCFRTRSILWSKWCSDFLWFFLVLAFQTSQGNEFETKFDISGDLKTNFMFVQWIWGSQISTLAVGKIEKMNLFQKLVLIFQTFWQPFGRMWIILLSFSYCNFEVSTLSTYHVGDPKNLLPIRHGSWGILTTRGFLIEREAGSTSHNLAVPRFYRCMCMCALLSLVLRSMIGIFIGILNGLILEASSISSRPKLLISLTWQVSISDKNCLLALIPLAAASPLTNYLTSFIAADVDGEAAPRTNAQFMIWVILLSIVIFGFREISKLVLSNLFYLAL